MTEPARRVPSSGHRDGQGSAPSGRSLGPALVVVVAGSAVLGGLTSFGQTYLPSWLRSFSNSMGGWTVLAFGLVWFSRARRSLGAVLGAVSFVTLNESYAIVSSWRGYFYAGLTSIWTLVGVLAGPFLGLGASLSRYGTPLWRCVGVAVPAAVLLGEGAWALRTVADTTSPVYWWLEIAGSVALMGVGVIRSRVRGRQLLLGIAVWLAGSTAFTVVASLLL